MSWALEEWKEGLPTKALQQIQALEGQLDKLKKEKQQRQFQLETLEAALQKQKQKVENEKNEGTNLKRENQRLVEICENLEKTKQKISHELQVKDSQVNFQEGQLSSSKKQIEKLEQELKRCKSELERSQQAAQSADVSLNSCGTPQKMFTTPLTPSQYYTGSKYEDLKEKYNKEVEERKRLEAEIKALQAKKASQAVPQTPMNHRDIARHQASSSVFSWQQEKTPSRLCASAQKTPIRRDGCASCLPGEEATPGRSALRTGKRDQNGTFFDHPNSSRPVDHVTAQNQELRSKVNELERCLQGQEKEMKSHVSKFQELQLQLEKTKMELTEKEKALNRSRDELVRTTAQCDQAAAKCATLEQKLKKLTEDLSCQRQNSESARCSLEQKIKEKEKEFQEELSRQQRAFQTLDQECTQMKVRLTQELQQAKNALNALQAELDKVTPIKQQLEKNLEELKQKFSRTEQALQVSPMAERELRRSSEETKKENGLLRSQSEQKAREVSQLEEELRKIKACLTQSQNFAEEMRAKRTSQEAMLRDLQEKLNQQENSLMLEKLKLALADLEKQRDCSQDLLKKREHHIEQLNEKLSKIEEEFRAVLSALELKKKEYEELKTEKTQFSHWKSENEKLLSQAESEKESLQSKITHLDACLRTQQIKSHEYNERVRTLEMEKENLNAEIRNLRGTIDRKTSEVETQKQAYAELQQKAEFSDQKHEKEMENMCLKTSQLTGQVEGLERQLQSMLSEIMAKDQHYQDLHSEYESLRTLLASKGSSPRAREDHQSCLAFEQQPATKSSFAPLTGEHGSAPPGGSEGPRGGGLSPRNPATLQNRVLSLESSLESQKQMNSDLQKQCEELVQIKGQIEENLMKAEQMHESFVAETSQRLSKLQEDTSAHQNVVAETLVALDNKEQEVQLLGEKLDAAQAEMEELKKSNRLLENTVKELQVLSETLGSEKKEMSSIISVSKKETEELVQENGTLKEMNEALSHEKVSLLQQNENFSYRMEELEKSISELSDQHKQERLLLLQQWEETRRALEDLSAKYKAAQEENSKLEYLLSESTSVCENRKNELEQLKETFVKEREEFLTKLAFAEERNEKLLLELEAVQQTLRSEITELKDSSKREADGLKQEIMTLKEDQSKTQREFNDLLRENERLMELTEARRECQPLELEPVKGSVKEAEHEVTKCDFQLQVDLEAEDASLDSDKAQLGQLDASIRNMALKLEENEKERERLQQELRTVRAALAAGNLQDSPAPEMSCLKDGEADAEERYISALRELSTSQNDNAGLRCSLQTAMHRLHELEQTCELLRCEKLELESELRGSRAECITATREMAVEVERLVKEAKLLRSGSDGLLLGESVRETADGELGGGGGEPASVSGHPSVHGSFCEHMTPSDKEVRAHFIELQEKFSCLQSEHKILHDQHHRMSAEVSELRSLADALRAENSALSGSLRDWQGDSGKELNHELPEGRALSLSSSPVSESPDVTGAGESSFYNDVLGQTGAPSLPSGLEGEAPASTANVDGAPGSSLDGENLAQRGIPSAAERSVEELATLCQLYLRSLKDLEEKMESQGVLKDEEIHELQRLLRSERSELDRLRKQYLSESEQWQQRLTSVTLEMESKLAAEKQQTQHLTLELEVARLQLQELDLSARSLLGTDVEDALQGQNDSCAIRESEEGTSETTKKTSKQDIDQIGDKDVQQDLGLETEKITQTGAVQLVGEGSGEQALETSSEAAAEDRAQDCSACPSELSFSGPGALVPMDFLENQVSIQNLYLQVKETVNENLRLRYTIEDQDKKVESLLNEIKELDSKLGLQEVQLKSKTEMCVRLEEVIEELKKEKSDLSERLESFSSNNQGLCQRAENSGSLSPELEMGTDEPSKEVTVDNSAEVEDTWKERFLDAENEPSRLTLEKAGIEHRALSTEAELEKIHTEKLRLEKDSENQQSVTVRLEEQLSMITSERSRLQGELETVSKENKALEQMSEEMKEKIQELETHQAESLRHIQAVEAEVRDKTELLQSLSCDVSELSKDKAQLQEQLMSLQQDSEALSLAARELEGQIGQLDGEKEALVRESEGLQAKLSESEREKLAVSEALEAALLEKGEFAARLGSTREEAHQLRRGIEKLRVRIEADEKKQLDMREELKASQCQSDALRDKVESLERELQMAEENQELVILDAENAKAEAETLKAKVEEMSESLSLLERDLAAVKSREENLSKQLQDKQGHVVELEGLLASCKGLLEEKEQARLQLKEESKAAVDALRAQLRELGEEVTCLCDDQETRKAEEQSPDAPREDAVQLRSSIARLKARIEADEQRHLRAGEQLEESQRHADLLKDRIENLKRELETSGKSRERAILEAENLKAEVETQKAKVQEMAHTLRDLESELVNARSEKENLVKELEKGQERVSELEVLNSSLENLLRERDQAKAQMKEDSETAVERLRVQVKELTEQMVALCSDQEAFKTKAQNLSSQVDSLELEKTQLLQNLEEAKNNYIILQSSVNGLLQEVEDGKEKLEKRNEEVRRLKDQLQDHEQLVSKLSQVEREQKLWEKQKLELGHLRAELEQKIQMLQSKNDTLQDTFGALQNSYKDLESQLESMKVEKMSFVEKINTMAVKEMELQGEIREMVQKTAEMKEEFSAEKNKLTEELKVLVEGLKSAKTDHLKHVNELTKEHERGLGKMKLLLKSCKQLEEEKKMLQKELSQLEAAQKQKTGPTVAANVDELMAEIQELKETLEEKSKEADDYLDKYCSLLISHEKLEKAKELLETQVAGLSSRQCKRGLQSPPLSPSVPEPSPVPPVPEKASSSGQNKASGKRQRCSAVLENGGGPTPPTPETFSKKSRKAVRSGGATPARDEEETEFEPEGLPEVVKKGFADIPTGRTSPFVLRRTTMATRASPRLAAQRSAASPLSLDKENLAEASGPTAGGSRPQKDKVARPSPTDAGTALRDPATRSGPVCQLPDSIPEDSAREAGRAKRGFRAPSPNLAAEPKSSENCKVQ